MRFDVVTGVEFVRVHKPQELFAACAEAGVPFWEVTQNMVWQANGSTLMDYIPYLRVEKTRRIGKARRERIKGVPIDTPEARRERVNRYRAMVESGVEQLFPD